MNEKLNKKEVSIKETLKMHRKIETVCLSKVEQRMFVGAFGMNLIYKARYLCLSIIQ